ncbi:MAG: MSMEG_4193 family putative phosphomutase [Catenulispora sp.]|nr:MSMEG_4193 family putative phosphomutase [Catenulispora sp.]
MSTVLLVRHGRTTANADGVLAGDLPVELDERGRQQATAVGERLAGLPLAAVVSSPLRRCRQTLELALPGRAPAIEPGLTECGYGTWVGKPLKELAKDPLWTTVQQHPAAVTFPGGEAMAAMATRAVAAVRAWDARVTAEHGAEALWVASSHGDVIKAIVADALGLHLDLFQRISVDPGSVTIIRYTPHRPFVLRLSDTGGDLSGLVQKPATVPAGDAPVGGTA